MAQTTRDTERTEVRTFLIVSAGAFALGLVLGVLLMGLY
jgi:predicted nucleic acid-binding Zn ribbon protein